jgi:hypothetical protein
MLVRDLLEVRRRQARGGSGSETSTIEMASDNDSIEIEVEFMFDVDPTEYEGNYVFSQGGVDLEDTKIEPFTFEKKRYTEITPEIVGYLEFPLKFDKQHKALIARAQDEDQKHPLTKKETDDLVNDYLVFVFDNYVADKIDVPTKHYPMTR